MLMEVNCSCTSEESQIMPAVLWTNFHKNPDTSQSVFVIPGLDWRHSQVHPKFSPALRCAPNLSQSLPMYTCISHQRYQLRLYLSSGIPVNSVPVVRDPSYCEGLPEYPPRVWYSPEVDASKFTLHIFSDTPGVFQRLQYILLMCVNCPVVHLSELICKHEELYVLDSV
jgi:hypothetical protein